MNTQTLNILLNIFLVAGGIMTLYAAYFVVVALFGFKKPVRYVKASPKTRFAVLIAARNEADVIGPLVDSLCRQNYPKEKYDILVAPNNCTDETEAVALAHGAKIYHAKGRITSKGQVLTQMVDTLMAGDYYDAVCVFDADNLVHPDFLTTMNNAYTAGVRVAQGFRDSKNPDDTAISTCYSVCYWMLNRFYNAGREALGLSGLINGSGFMVSLPLLRSLGGWHTRTMTEDYEFTAQCVLAGNKVHYVQDAVIYDEQPLTFLQSWRQRRRWSTGSVEGMQIYLGELMRHGRKTRSWTSVDLALTFMTPAVQLVSLLLSAATVLLGAYRVFGLHLVPFTQVVLWGSLLVAGAFSLCCLLAGFVIWLNRGGRLRGFGKGIACFALFLLSWMPIGIISLFKKKKTWDSIAHTRAVSVADLQTGG